MDSVGLEAYLIVGAVLFVCGVVCMATKRNGIGVLMGVELVLNGANVNFVAFSRYTPLGLDGQATALFVVVLAAAEAAVGGERKNLGQAGHPRAIDRMLMRVRQRQRAAGPDAPDIQCFDFRQGQVAD